MAKIKSTFKNMFLSLSIICLVMAGLLALVNNMTAGPIEEMKALKLQNAIREVMPEFDNDPASEAYFAADNYGEGMGDSLLIYPARKGDEVVGYAINSFSDNGFSGRIEIMVGFDTSNNIVNYAVLSHAETPGLGAKVGTWFKETSKPTQSIIGHNMEESALAVSKDGGQVDAITAATITSRAFLEAVNRAYSGYMGQTTDMQTGATDTTSSKASQETEEQTNRESVKTGTTSSISSQEMKDQTDSETEVQTPTAGQ